MWKTTLLSFVISMGIGTPLGLMFAYYISKKLPGAGAFRVLLFLPSVISAIVMVTIYRFFVERAVPEIVYMLVGTRPKGLMENPDTRFGVIMFYNIWVSFGVNVLMYSNAMSGIAPEVVESAQIDGASRLREFVSISLPGIFPTLTTFLITGVAAIFTNQYNMYSFYGDSSPSKLLNFGYYFYRTTQSATSPGGILGYFGRRAAAHLHRPAADASRQVGAGKIRSVRGLGEDAREKERTNYPPDIPVCAGTRRLPRAVCRLAVCTFAVGIYDVVQAAVRFPAECARLSRSAGVELFVRAEPVQSAGNDRSRRHRDHDGAHVRVHHSVRGGCAFFNTLVPCVTAYCCARFNKKLSSILYTANIVTMILPIVGSLPAELQMARTLGLYDQIWGLWIMKANFLGTYFLVFHAGFRSLPLTYTEAAEIDGAGSFRIFFRIILPLVKNIFFTVLLVNFIAFWNDYQVPLLYMPRYPTLANGVYMLATTTENNLATVPMRMTGAMLLFLPIFCLFVIFQKRLLGSLTMGGIKG